MGRYLTLYMHFLRFSLSSALIFRADFFFRVIMDVAFYAMSVAFFKVIYMHTSILGGWDEGQIMIFVGVCFVIDALFMTLFSDNLWAFPQMINKGDLDYYLLRPVSTLFFVSLRKFAANSFLNLVIAIGFLAWSIVNYPKEFTPASYVLLLVGLMMGSFLHYMSNMIFLIPAFWTHSARGLGVVWFSLSRFYEKPDRIFTGTIRVILTTALPFALMASFPTRLFIEDFEPWVLGTMCGVTVFIWSVMVGMWLLGLRSYSSASS